MPCPISTRRTCHTLNSSIGRFTLQPPVRTSWLMLSRSHVDFPLSQSYCFAIISSCCFAVIFMLMPTSFFGGGGGSYSPSFFDVLLPLPFRQGHLHRRVAGVFSPFHRPWLQSSVDCYPPFLLLLLHQLKAKAKAMPSVTSTTYLGYRQSSPESPQLESSARSPLVRTSYRFVTSDSRHIPNVLSSRRHLTPSLLRFSSLVSRSSSS